MGNEKGFTLIEIITVLVLVGVVSSIAIISTSTGNADLSASTDKLKVHLRYAQSRAMNSDTSWGIQFNGASYTLLKDMGGTNQPVVLPGESSLSVSLPLSLAGSVKFDTWGHPTGLSTIVLGSASIVITPDTGFIP
jgi:MSHA pilin protein MshC